MYLLQAFLRFLTVKFDLEEGFKTKHYLSAMLPF